MKSYRTKKNLTIQSIRVGLCEKGSNRYKRIIFMDQTQKNRIFIPSKRYLQSKLSKNTEQQKPTDRCISVQFEIQRKKSQCLKQKEDYKQIKKQIGYMKEINKLKLSLKRSYKLQKIGEQKKRIQVSHQQQKNISISKCSSQKINKFRLNKYPSIISKKQTQPNDNLIYSPKSSLLLYPFDVSLDLPKSVQRKFESKLSENKSKKGEILNIRKHSDRSAKLSSQHLQTHISPWKVQKFDQSSNRFSSET